MQIAQNKQSDATALQNSRNKIKTSKGPTRFYKVVALNCCTVDEKKNPIFFLFSDIDDKDPFHLSRILKFFAKAKLSFYWYETAKGYHVISPCLLDIEEWYKLRRGLKMVENGYFEGLNLRVSKKGNDPKDKNLFFEPSYNHSYKESIDLQSFLVKNHKFLPTKTDQLSRSKLLESNRLIRTQLNFSKYEEINVLGVDY